MTRDINLAWCMRLSEEVMKYLSEHDDVFSSAELRKIFRRQCDTMYDILGELSKEGKISYKMIHGRKYYWKRP